MKTKLLLAFIVIALGSKTSFGQDEPIYHDGLYDLYKLIGENIKYPPNDRKKGLEGQVLRAVIYTPLLGASCGHRFEKDKEYIVYASKNNFLSFLFKKGRDNKV